MGTMGPDLQEAIEPSPAAPPWWSRLWHDPLARILAIAGVVLAGAVVVLLVLSIDNFNVAATVQDERDALKTRVQTLERDTGRLERQVETYKPVYDLAGDVADREVAVVEREAEANRREEASAAAEASVAARESAVAAREQAANANTESWVEKVRECLGRGGTFRSATVTVGLGGGFTCYTA